MGNGARPRYEGHRQNPSRLNTTETPNSIVSVGIVEDQRRTREGLCALIDGSEGFHCVGAWRSMEEALSAPHTSSQPQVILLDLGLPGMSGIDGIPRLREKWPGAALVALTVYEDNDRVFEALCAGATGYLLKNTAPAKLLESVKDAVRGGAPMSPGIARQVVDLFRRYRPPDRLDCDLTQQEVRPLKLLVEGHSYKTAANELAVTVNTVAFHIKSIYGKLQVHSKSEAVARALRDNLIGLSVGRAISRQPPSGRLLPPRRSLLEAGCRLIARPT